MVKTAFWGISAAALLAAAPAWAELKIGYVNYTQLIEAAPQSKTITDAIRNEFQPRQRELQNQQQALKAKSEKLQKDAATMTDDQRSRAEKELRDSDRDLQRKQAEFNDDLNARRNEELSRLQRTLIEQVRTYAKAQNFDLVIADGVIYANTSVDITPAILSQLQSSAPKTSGGPAPTSPPAKPAGK